MFLNFLGSVPNFFTFIMSFIIKVKKCLFPLDAYVVSFPSQTKNLGRNLFAHPDFAGIEKRTEIHKQSSCPPRI